MDTVGKALWYIESHFGGPVALDEVADAVGLSRFHLSRVFAQTTGRSFVGYLRGRRLTEAAKVLADGAPDILSVALDAGYGSHEAFSRAFRDRFGLTPEAVRAGRALDSLNLVEPIKMTMTASIPLAEPHVCKCGPLLIVGLRSYVAFEDRAVLPALWQRFGPHVGSVPGEIAGATYGVCLPPQSGDGADGFDYVCGVAVRSLDEMPADLVGVRVPARTWAIFSHLDHVSTVAVTCAAAGEWLARSGRAPSDGADQMIERYGPEFDPRTGVGGCEVWVPVRE